MAFTESVIALAGFAGMQLLQWFYLFYVPFTQINIIWIIIPIYVNWIISEIWQEKRFTAYGNAISNGVIVLWVGIDWGRRLTEALQEGTDSHVAVKLVITFLMLLYGLVIIIYGIKAREFIHYAGRVRVVTYLMLMFMPIMYDLVPASIGVFIRIFLFLPIFYFFIEFIDWLIPDPKTLDEDTASYNKTHDLPDIPGMDQYSQLPPVDMQQYDIKRRWK